MQRAADTTPAIRLPAEATHDSSNRRRTWYSTIETLYRDEFDALCGNAKRYLDTDHAAEEVVQEAFARFASMTTRPRSGCELSYLRSIVINEARSALRRRQVADRHRAARAEMGVPDETVEHALQRTTQTHIHRHLATLPLRQRQVLVLRHLEGMSERETADLLSISPGSVKTHTSRAMSAMRLKVGAAA